MSGIWHIWSPHGSRAFVRPGGWRRRCSLMLRGWRPFNGIWWSKPSARTRAAWGR